MTAVLLIAGLGGRGSFWDGQVSALAPRFEPIAFDHRGRDSVEALAQDALALLDARGIERCHVVGHSLGGAVAQVIAEDYPERVGRLVLSATWCGPTAPFKALFELRKRVLSELGAGAAATLGALIAWPDDWLERHPELLRAGGDSADALRARLDAILGFDRSSRLAEIRAPTLVVCAQDDRVVPPGHSRRIAAGVPGSILRLLPGGGHFPQATATDAYNVVLLEFLEDAR
ncbi:MAG TPA: alpha/beta fold hydrolase [Burkholderiales bacterium]|nr:alpha/beta fold hydrolase [Burkholderiales bacterium]